MNILLEHPISIIQQPEEVYKEFGMMCVVINSVENMESVRIILDQCTFKHFKYGFGGSHFWAKQIINGELSERVIFKQF